MLLGVGLELGVGANSYLCDDGYDDDDDEACCVCESDDAGLLARDIYCAGRGEEPPTGMGTTRRATFGCARRSFGCVDRVLTVCGMYVTVLPPERDTG